MSKRIRWQIRAGWDGGKKERETVRYTISTSLENYDRRSLKRDEGDGRRSKRATPEFFEGVR